MKTYLVQKNTNSKIKYIVLTQSANTLSREWGILNGKTQTTTAEYKAINVGKVNEISAEEAAIQDMERVVKKKVKEGYIVVQSLLEPINLTDPFERLDLDFIDTAFCCSKPIAKPPLKQLQEVFSAHNALTHVKYNGGCHYISVNSRRKVKLLTRRWDDHTSKYPDIVDAVYEMNLPHNTLLITEFCVDPLLDLPHMVAFNYFSEIAKTATVKGVCKCPQDAAIALQAKHPVRVAVFGILYYGGEQLWHIPYKEQWAKILHLFEPISKKQVLFRPQIVEAKNAASLGQLARRFKSTIEGFVVWDTTKSMEVTMNGKPARRAAYKYKVAGEMDVIAYEGKEGKIVGKYGSIAIGRYDPQKQFIPMGTVGGLKTHETEPDYWRFPCVIEVNYDNVFPDTGKLQFGKFSKIHEDKQIEEVDYFSKG